ncbi:MAG TPA: class D sortase [Candidatus Acidoferrum sp.]|nr:class D sortase [Candidatus Acidoferrum sp.]
MNPAIARINKDGAGGTFLLRWTSFALVLAGVIAVGYSGYVVVYSQAYQTIELRTFEHNPRLAEPHLLNSGDVIGEIQIPRLGVKAVIVQGDAPELLDRAVGHIPQTALPGEWGNVALAGHRDRLFRPLRQVHQGDTIVLETAIGSFTYQVESTFVVPSSEVGVLRSSSTNELTLITCFPFDYIGHAPKRFIVRGREVGSSRK